MKKQLNKNNIQKIFKDEVYKIQVHAFMCDRETIASFMGFSVDKIKNYKAFVDEKDNYLVLWLNESANIKIMAHEIIHLVTRVFQKRKVSLNLGHGDEHFAYYYTYWFDVLGKFFFMRDENGNKK